MLLTRILYDLDKVFLAQFRPPGPSPQPLLSAYSKFIHQETVDCWFQAALNGKFVFIPVLRPWQELVGDIICRTKHDFHWGKDEKVHKFLAEILQRKALGHVLTLFADEMSDDV